jgi:hypothetical protein
MRHPGRGGYIGVPHQAPIHRMYWRLLVTPSRPFGRILLLPAASKSLPDQGP